MKKFIISLALLLLMILPAISAQAAGTSFINGLSISYYSLSTYNCSAAYPTLITNTTASLTDASNTSYTSVNTAWCNFVKWNTKKTVDGVSINHYSQESVATTYTFTFFDQLDAPIGTRTITFPASSTSTGIVDFTPINAYGMTFKMTGTSSTAISDLKLYASPDTTPPAKPTLTSATGGNQQITIVWTKPTDSDLAGYKIYRNGTFLTTVSNKEQLSFTNTGLTPGISYSYTVTAYDDTTPTANESAPSNSMSATATDTTAPTTPGTPTVTGFDNGVTLSWTASTDNYQLASYRIYQLISGAYQLIKTINAPSITTTVTGLTNNTTYFFKVQAVDSYNNVSSQSSAGSGIPVDNVPPAKPSNFSLKTASETSITVQWDTNTTDADMINGYYVVSRFANFNPSFTVSHIPSNTKTEYTFTSLTGQTSYNFYVKAIDDDTNSSSTATLTASTIANPPVAPTGLTATPDDKKVTLSWTANNESDHKGYYVYKGTTKIATLGKLTSYVDTNVVNKTEVCYQISAIDVFDFESTKSVQQCTTPEDTTPPDAPELSGLAGNLKITLTWTKPTAADLVGYKIYRNNVLYQTITNKEILKVDIPQNALGVNVNFYVQAYDDDELTSSSNTIIAQAIDNEPPTPPTNLTAQPGDKQVILTWTASTDNDKVQGYNIYYKIISEITGQVVGTTNQTTYTVTNLINNTSYLFSVEAYDPSGNLSNQTSIQATPMDNTPPNQGNLTLVSVSKTKIKVSWPKSSSTDIASYRISKDNFSNYITINDDGSATYEYEFTGLNSGEKYTISIKAVDDDGNISTAKSLEQYTASNAPASPAGLTLTGGDKKADATWQENGESDLGGYKLYKVISGGTTLVANVGNVTTYEITNLTNDVNVCFQLSAYDLYNNESPKSAQSCVTPSDTVPPDDISDLAIDSTNEYDATITWTASPSSDIKGYKIYKNNTFVVNVLHPTTTYTAVGLTPGVNYVFSVKPYDVKNNLNTTGTTTITVQTTAVAPTKPSNFTATATTTTINFSWIANPETTSDLAGYVLKKSESSGYTQIAELTSDITSYSYTPPDDSSATYFIQAYDIGGTYSVPSDSVTVALAPVTPPGPTPHPFEGVMSPVDAGDVVSSTFGFIGIGKWILLLFLVILFAMKFYESYKKSTTISTKVENESVPKTEQELKNEKEQVKRRRRRRKAKGFFDYLYLKMSEASEKRKMKEQAEKKKEKERAMKKRVTEVKRNIRKKLSESIGAKVYKQD